MSDIEEKSYKRKRSEKRSNSVKDTSDDNDSSLEVHEEASATTVNFTDREDEKINDMMRDKDNLVPETSAGDQSRGPLCDDKTNLNLSLELVSPTSATGRDSDEHPFGVNIEIIVKPKDATPNYPPDEVGETKNNELEKKKISNNAMDGPSPSNSGKLPIDSRETTGLNLSLLPAELSPSNSGKLPIDSREMTGLNLSLLPAEPSLSNTGKLPIDSRETTGLNLSLLPADSNAQGQINQDASRGCFSSILKEKDKVKLKLFGVTCEVEQLEQASNVSQRFAVPTLGPQCPEASHKDLQCQQQLSCSIFENKGYVERKALQHSHCFGEGSSSSSRYENLPENFQKEPTEWLEEELDCLWVGVRRHGQQNWNTLLADPNLSFKRFRVAEDFNRQWERELAKILNGIMIPHPMGAKPPLAPPLGRALVRTACPNNRQLNSSHIRIQMSQFGYSPPHQTSTGPPTLANQCPPKNTLPHWLVDALKGNQKNSEPPLSSPNAADPAGCGENRRKRAAPSGDVDISNYS